MRYKLFLSASSGFLLSLAFPRWNLWWLAWLSFIPLLRVLESVKNKKEAFCYSYLAGFVFYLLSVTWLRHVTVFGLFFVVTVLAIYWGIFGVIAVGAGLVPARGKTLRSRAPTRGAPTIILCAVWTALEFVRSEWPVWGFGWNLLGYSQAPNLFAAQLASLGGVYAVSFLVFLGNMVAHRLFREGLRKNIQMAGLFLMFLSAVLLFGWSRIQTQISHSDFRVSVLQGNVPQLLKWDEKYKEEILKIYLNLTELASFDRPRLIVWPESAYPGFFNLEPEADQIRGLVQKIQIPLLLGSPHLEDRKVYYNSAYLLNSSGEWVERYDKIRLVPFGEYVPWKPIFGLLERYAYSLGVSDFSAGGEWTIFQMGEKGPKFSVLICFEDIFPGIARKFVDQGAGFLTVITNDAWFGHSSAPYQHLQASVFRAIENGVTVVRSANTGVSGFISSRGQVVERVRNQEEKDTFVMGGVTSPVVTTSEMTPYRRGGWIFPYVCLGITILFFLILGIGKMRLSRAAISMMILFFLSACVRLKGGMFYAKKDPQGDTQVKELSVDTDQLLNRGKTPGKIEVADGN